MRVGRLVGLVEDLRCSVKRSRPRIYEGTVLEGCASFHSQCGSVVPCPALPGRASMTSMRSRRFYFSYQYPHDCEFALNTLYSALFRRNTCVLNYPAPLGHFGSDLGGKLLRRAGDNFDLHFRKLLLDIRLIQDA